MSEMNNPDAGADKQLIIQTMRDELGPVLKVLVQRIESAENDCQELKKVITGIVSGFHESLIGHRRGSLMDSLSLGDDYDDINGVYKDWEGSDMKEDLIDYILENDISDEQLEDIKNTVMENARGKYGKYAPKKAPVEGVAIEVGGSTEKDGPESGESGPEKETGKKKSPADSMYEKLMGQHRAARGVKI